MVLLHIAHIETAIVGGVNIAVPKMVNSQKEFAHVGIVNLTEEPIDSVPTFCLKDFWDKKIPEPFQKPDLVVFHEVYRPPFLKLASFFRKEKIPYIVISHGCLTKTAQQKKFFKKRIANLLLFQKFLKNAVSIQYLSRREQEQSTFSYPSLVLPNGITLPHQFRTTPLSESIKLLYIGRLEIDIKGLDLLLDAINLQQEKMRATNTTLIIHGPNKDPSREELKHLIETYQISDLVSLEGEVWGKEKEKVLLCSDYFIQTSRSEGMPMGLLEAMAHGLPVIVTEGTGFAESVTEHQCGFGCKTAKEDIALAIEQAIINRDGYQTLSRHARKLIQDNFEENKVAEQSVMTYRNLIR